MLFRSLFVLFAGLLTGCAHKPESFQPKHGAVCFTFDDAQYRQWIPQIPLFEKYHAKATFFYSGEITKEAADGQTENGTGTEATGTDLSDWVSYDSENGIGMTLAGAAAYRTSGASKATPGFDVMDYGQEDYVFGSFAADARHWDRYVLKVLEENADTLAELFNAG